MLKKKQTIIIVILSLVLVVIAILIFIPIDIQTPDSSSKNNKPISQNTTSNDLLSDKEKKELDIREEYKVKAIERDDEGNVLTYKIIDHPPDADNDGLFDYEEEKKGTDKHDMDTDGDGVMDRIEIQQGTDPTKKNDFHKKKEKNQ